MPRMLVVTIGTLRIGAQVSELGADEADLYDVRLLDNALRFRIPRTPDVDALRDEPVKDRLLLYDGQTYRIRSWSESASMVSIVAETNRLGGA